MPHDLRKTRKKRGSRTVGWGRVGQHRRTGGKPYRNPGRHKALWSYVIKYDPDYYSIMSFMRIENGKYMSSYWYYSKEYWTTANKGYYAI